MQRALRVNAVLQEISEGRRPVFRIWAQFRDAMVQRFEPVTEVEEARKQLRALRQTGRVPGYVQKFQELQYRLPGMTDEEVLPCLPFWTVAAPIGARWGPRARRSGGCHRHGPASGGLS